MADDFYQNDICLGGICIINGKNAYDLFNADLVSVEPVAGSIDATYKQAISASDIAVLSHQINAGGIKLTFYVGGASKEDCDLHTSNLVVECKKCLIKIEGDIFEYPAVLTSYTVKNTGVEFFNEVSLTFVAIKRYSLVTEQFEAGGTLSFNNAGNITSGARITITPNVDFTTLQIGDVTVKDLTAGLPFVIDGLVGEVKCNGVNRFIDTDLIDFPKVMPGENKIVVSDTNVKVEIAFYPTFVM